MLLWLVAALTAGTLAPPGPVGTTGRQGDFAAAAREFGVPESVLLGVSYLESRWDANGGRPSVAGGYGPMHLVDARAAAPAGPLHPQGDARGDDSRPMGPLPEISPEPSAERRAPADTLRQAGRLAGLTPDTLRRDPAANIRAGAALLASYQAAPSSDPADWYAAVARYSGADDQAAGRAFADQVYAVLREGASRVTDDGFAVRLDPQPGLRPEAAGAPAGTGALRGPGAPSPAAPPPAPGGAECPATLSCEWMPAAYERFGKRKNRDYGNHDRMIQARPIDYIVIHDTEGGYAGVPSMVRNPRYVSWHYTIRSADGHVAQHVPTRDIAWHSGNWDVNSRSIGIEHEGYLAKGTWYTEAMYRSSAALVKYLAARYHIPIDRAHILGHDNVPGSTPKSVAGMHEDPGPYWDWAHYFELMGHPLTPPRNTSGSSVIIRPAYTVNLSYFTGCAATDSSRRCAPRGASTVWLRTAPNPDAPLVTDRGKHRGRPATYSVYDHSARASTGQRYAVAGRQGDWTAIWYLGQRAWFYNPASNPSAVAARGPLVTPIRRDVRVYGRAYPERSAYRGTRPERLVPLQYRISPGQLYALGDTFTGMHISADSFDPARHVITRGRLRYHQIQLGHRVMFVKADDVRVIR
ncbi:peptidoglycan recognition family protein [Nonomuraea pusilla]|uniref:N-acetylmuramoyl-L-alanine amidase n=1 Tax=Nonomuraea pusilla TaxID=46177 RepID=A0A1H7KLR8_9ACTN|nr:peptidoglycan recognition family protein [Nonomuraea pusilla]SEK87813.1 N-acetylmuramoyl-L-alanine amidase [Nonomuraea pusilla]